MQTPAAHRRPISSQRGLTLVECAITLSVIAIAVGAAAPSFVGARDRRHLEGTAAQLETDLQLARSAAVAASRSVRMSFSGGAGASCYVVHTGAAGSCSCKADGSAACAAGSEALRSVHLPAGAPVRIESNAASILFDATRGTVTPTATVKLHGQSGTLHAVVNLMGRVRQCTPDAALPGYKPC